jgi:hypothetical protein
MQEQVCLLASRLSQHADAKQRMLAQTTWRFGVMTSVHGRITGSFQPGRFEPVAVFRPGWCAGLACGVPELGHWW